MPWRAARSHEGRFRAEPVPRGQPAGQGRPTRRRMSAGVAPRARSSRIPVAADRLRQLPPLAVEHEAVVPVGRLRQAEQMLQQPVHAGRPEQVGAAHHLGDALQGVVDHHREVIAGRRLLAREDDVAPAFRPGGHRAGLAIGTVAVLGPAEIGGPRARRRHVEPQRIGHARFEQPRALRPATATSPSPDRAARHRDRAARAPAPRAAPPALRSRRGFRRPDRSGPMAVSLSSAAR